MLLFTVEAGFFESAIIDRCFLPQAIKQNNCRKEADLCVLICKLCLLYHPRRVPTALRDDVVGPELAQEALQSARAINEEALQRVCSTLFQPGCSFYKTFQIQCSTVIFAFRAVLNDNWHSGSQPGKSPGNIESWHGEDPP